MAETRMTTDIGTRAIRRNQEYKCCGVLLIEKKKWILPGHEWIQRYFIITKGAKNCCWNLFCFMDQFATKAEWAYSMKEMESVREYCKEDDDIVGFRIVFEAAKMPEIILRCDTEENRVMWLSNMREAITEAHSYSMDSGFGSGASVTSLQKRVSRHSQNYNRKSDNYDIIEEDYNAEKQEAGNTCSSLLEIPNNAERVNVEYQSNQRAFKRRQKKEADNYEEVVMENGSYKIQERKKFDCAVKKIEETMLKLPISVEETNDPQVMLRGPSNKPLTQEMTDKRKAVVVTTNVLPVDISALTQYKGSEESVEDKTVQGISEETICKRLVEIPTIDGNAGAISLPLSQSLARSESFVSVEAASDTLHTISSTSSLHVSCGSADTSLNTRDYVNVELRMHTSSSNERNSSSSSGSDTFEKPTRFSLVVKPDEYFCEEGQNPKTVLKDTPEGTFLVHRKKKGLRLHVMTQAGVKCFKLFEQNEKVSLYEDFSISPDSVFSSLDNFLKHYNVHCIPKEEFSVRLIQGYRNVITERAETEWN